MASLRDSVKDYQEELRDGIAWVAFWKEGRSWNEMCIRDSYHAERQRPFKQPRSREHL